MDLLFFFLRVKRSFIFTKADETNVIRCRRYKRSNKYPEHGAKMLQKD